MGEPMTDRLEALEHPVHVAQVVDLGGRIHDDVSVGRESGKADYSSIARLSQPAGASNQPADARMSGTSHRPSILPGSSD